MPIPVIAKTRLLPAALLALLLLAVPACAQTLLDMMKQPGSITLMRHANAPLEGAPSSKAPGANNLADCATQRNLGDAGRAQARRLNGVFAQAGVRFEHVYASAFCRCQDTADLIMGAKVAVLPQLTSFYVKPPPGQDYVLTEKDAAQIAALKAFMLALPPGDRALLVTHGSVVEAMADIDTDDTEVAVMVRDGAGGFKMIGRGVP